MTGYMPGGSMTDQPDLDALDDGRPGVLLFPIAGRARAVAVTDTQARRLVKL